MNSLFDNIWQQHIIEDLGDSNYLLSIDRCYLHDLSGPSAINLLKSAGLEPFDANRVIAIPDHTLSSRPGRDENSSPISATCLPAFRQGCQQYGIQMLDLDSPYQGIVHVAGPELGLSLPGSTIVCGDSHTCTHGALGALAWGVGTSELYHVLATQTLMVKKPKTMRIHLTGCISPELDAMDIILYIISQKGSDFGLGYAIEYSGPIIDEMNMEDRMCLCNLTVELGSEYALIAPDQKTEEYLKKAAFAPKGDILKSLITYSRTIASSAESYFDSKVSIYLDNLKSQVSWGITPAQTGDIDAVVPASAPADACTYMGVTAGEHISDLAIDQVFIGSCSNGRLLNLRKIACLVKGKSVAQGVEAWIVPGSQQVKRQAEQEGLDKVFTAAGFVWGEPCCSLCGGCNGERIKSGKRCISTTNRNFIGRQGPGSRTHLASPTTAAKAALSGRIGGC